MPAVDQRRSQTESEAALLTALSVEPDNLDFMYALADHYVNRDDLLAALRMAERMIASHPENEIGHQMKARIEAARR